MKTRLTMFAVVAALLSGCATDSQNQYSASDIGQEINVQFGTIIAKRTVKINEKSTGTGTAVGTLGGAAAGSAFGQGNGQLVGVLAGAVVGAIAGHVVESQMNNRDGIEYTISKTSGHVVTIVQNIAQDDVPLNVGQKVMIQTSGRTEIKSGDTTTKQSGADYVRVLPVEQFPAEVVPAASPKKAKTK